MKCPYCNGDMEQGYLHSGYRIFWSGEDRGYIFIPRPRKKKGDIAITRTIYEGHTGGKSSYLCRSCGKVIFDICMDEEDC